MSVTLPTGWTTFTGGATIPLLCGEPQDCPEPPCGEIPPLVITPTNPGGGVPDSITCHPDGYQLVLEVTGGVPPFIWAASTGNLAVTEIRTATIDIAHDMTEILADRDEKIGNIAFFKPHMFTYASQVITPHPHCDDQGSNSYYRDATVDVRLRAYDCLKRHIIELNDSGTEFIDNIQVDDTNGGDDLDNPIGDNSADRSCVLSHDWPFIDTPTPSHPLTDPDHWSVSATGCGGNDTGNVSVHVTAATAGKNAIHGTVHSEAPAYSKTENIVIDQVGALDIPPTRDTDFEDGYYIDVRTQVQVDTECCVVPAGEEITVTVVDAQGVVAIIVIPVIEPTL